LLDDGFQAQVAVSRWDRVEYPDGVLVSANLLIRPNGRGRGCRVGFGTWSE
jgi:hypothetical protein